jgi:hypothetical protein
MTNDYVLENIESSASYIHAYWTYVEEKERYVDFVALPEPKGTAKTLLSNYVCLGQALFEPGGGITGIDYTYRQLALFVYGLSYTFIHEVAGDLLSGDGVNVRVEYFPGDDPIILISASSGAGDHGELLGLADDDHLQYIPKDGSRPLGGNWNTGQVYGISAYRLSGAYMSAGEMWTSDSITHVSAYTFNMLSDILSGGDGISIVPETNTINISAVAITGSILTDETKVALLKTNRGNLFNQYVSSPISLPGPWIWSYVKPMSAISSKNVKIDPESLGAMGLTTTQSTNSVRYNGVGLSLKGFGYVVAGHDASAEIDSIERFHDGHLTWQIVQAAVSAREYLAGFSTDDRLYVFAGYTATPSPTYIGYIESYNPMTDVWEAETSTGLTLRSGPGCFELHGYGYGIGGFDGTDYLSANERYNPEADTWSTKQYLPICAAWGNGFSIDGYGYFSNGINAAGRTNNIFRYDFSTDTWLTKPPTLCAGSNAGTFSMLGRGYKVGGLDLGGNYYDNILEYDPETDVWTVVDILTSGTSGPQAFELNGIGHVAGGYNGADVLSNVFQLRTCAMYQIPGSFYRSDFYPRIIWVGVNMNGKPMNGLPVQITTSAASGILSASRFGENIVSMKSNVFQSEYKWGASASEPLPTWNPSDPSLSGLYPLTAQPLSGYFASGANGWDYRIRIGIPRYSRIRQGESDPSGRSLWINIGEMPATASHMLAGHFNGFGYVFESTSGMRLNDVANYWTVGFPGPGLVTSAINTDFALEGFFYGTDGTSAVRFDDIGNSWTNVSAPASALGSAAGFSLHGYGYQAGGISAGVIYQSLLQYNPGTDAWTQKADMNLAVYEHGAFHMNGFGYQAGGLSAASGETDRVMRYNDAIDYWNNMTDLSFARHRFGSVSWKSKGFAGMGRHTNESDFTSIVETYADKEQAAGVWLTEYYLSAFDLPGTFAYADSVYFVGGYDGSSWYRTVQKRIEPSTYTEMEYHRAVPEPDLDITVTLFVEELDYQIWGHI